MNRYLIIIISIILGIMCGLVAFNTNIAVGLFGILILIFTIIKTDVTYNVLLIAALSVPTQLYSVFKLQYGSFDVISIGICGLLCITLAKSFANKTEFGANKLFIVNFLLLSFIIIYGIARGIGSTYMISDIKVYLFYLTYILAIFYLKDNFKTFLKLLFISCIIMSVIVIFVYLFKNTIFQSIFENTFYSNDQRVGFGNQTIMIIAVPLMLIAFYYKLFNRGFLFTSIAISLISIIISEGRSLIISVSINLVITVFYLIYKNNKTLGMKILKVFMTSIAGVLLVTVIYFLLREKMTLVFMRIAEMGSGSISSSLTRNLTNNAAMQDLINNPVMGFGIGKEMKLFGVAGFVKDGPFIDNAFLTLAYKFGVFGLLVFILNYFILFRRIYKRSKSSIYTKCIVFCLPLFIISSSYVTAQIVYNISVNTFLMSLFSIFSFNYSVDKLNTDP